MSKFYLKASEEDGDGGYARIGPYPTAKMAEGMAATYSAIYKIKYKVVEENE